MAKGDFNSDNQQRRVSFYCSVQGEHTDPGSAQQAYGSGSLMGVQAPGDALQEDLTGVPEEHSSCLYQEKCPPQRSAVRSRPKHHEQPVGLLVAGPASRQPGQVPSPLA